jgi:hypothetical protein
MYPDELCPTQHRNKGNLSMLETSNHYIPTIHPLPTAIDLLTNALTQVIHNCIWVQVLGFENRDQGLEGHDFLEFNSKLC